MSKITTTIDASRFERRVAKFDVKMRENIVKKLNVLGTMTTNDIRGRMNKDTSNMRNQLRAHHATPEKLVETIVAGAKYTSVQDDAKGKRWFPPTKALIESGWARRHNKSKEISNAAFAFLVARAISRKGIKPHHFIKPAIEPARAKMLEFMKEAVKGSW